MILNIKNVFIKMIIFKEFIHNLNYHLYGFYVKDKFYSEVDMMDHAIASDSITLKEVIDINKKLNMSMILVMDGYMKLHLINMLKP
ncbi:MAG: hypothetical protein LBR15_04650 [Methanobrevibacter sp.]|jgi:hypothetical protein|nr:hypothetical protein [Candidatus Methanovirga australis]